MRPSDLAGASWPLQLAIASVLAAMVGSGIAHGQGVDVQTWLSGLPGCVFRVITGLPCPGCGMTRALLLIGQLRVPEALAAHPLAPVLLAAMVTGLTGRPRLRGAGSQVLAGGLLVVVLLVWGLRLALGTIPA